MSGTTDTFAIDPAAQDVLFRTARTANTFTADPVSDAQVEALYDLVKWGPTSMNSVPLRMLLVRSPEARERLVGHLLEGNKRKTASAPLVAVLCYDADFHEHLATTFPVFPGAKDLFADAEQRRHFALQQAWLQAGYFIVGVRALGLAAGPMTGFDAPGLDADLLAGTSWRSICVVNIGHPGPDAWFDRQPRLAFSDVVTTV